MCRNNKCGDLGIVFYRFLLLLDVDREKLLKRYNLVYDVVG